jgi:Extracellular link domain/F5/8 type C domain
MSWLIHTLLGVFIIILLGCIIYLSIPQFTKKEEIKEGMLDFFNVEDYLKTLPTTVARYVRIRPADSGGDGYITISQIQVIDINGNNIAKGAAVSATSTLTGSANPSVVVDGVTIGRSGAGNVWTSGSTNRATEYLQIDLGSPSQIDKVIYTGQLDSTAGRAQGMICQILNTDFTVATSQTFINNSPSQTLTFPNAINITPNVTGMTGNPLISRLIPLNSAQPEVFLLTGTHTKSRASMQCSMLGATVATYDQLVNAHKSGAEWCSSAWVQDRSDAYYPMQVARTGCGSGSGVQTLAAGYLTNSDQTQMSITNGTRAVSTALAGVNCFGIKPAQGINSSISPFSPSEWSQYVNNAKPAYFGTTTLVVPDIQKVYRYVAANFDSDKSYYPTPESWITARPDLANGSIYNSLIKTSPLIFLYDLGTPAATIQTLNSTIQIFGTVTAANIADMNTSIDLCNKIYLGLPNDVDKFINITSSDLKPNMTGIPSSDQYKSLKPYMRYTPSWTNYCMPELLQTVSKDTGDYAFNVNANNKRNNQMRCARQITTDMLAYLPTPARNFLIDWIYNRTKRIVKFMATSDPNSEKVVGEVTKMIPTSNGVALTFDVLDKYNINNIAQSFYEAMGGNYIMSYIYDVFTVGNTILDVRFDLTKHGDNSAIQQKIADIKTKYNTIRNSNVSKDILDKAKENYDAAMIDLQGEQSANILPAINGVVARFFYTYDIAIGKLDITGFTLDARAVTSFIRELNCGIDTATGNAPGALSYTPSIIYTKNIPEVLNCGDTLTLKKILDDYLDLSITELAGTLLGTANGDTYTGPAGGPSMDTSKGTIQIDEIMSAVQISPTQCAIRWKETLFSDTENKPISAALTKVTRNALFSYNVNTSDWYTSDITIDPSGVILYPTTSIPQCVFDIESYKKLVAPRLDSLNTTVDADILKIKDDFIVNTWNNGAGNICPKEIPNYRFDALDYCLANANVNSTFNNGGKGPLNVAGATSHYITTGLKSAGAGLPIRAAQTITPLTTSIAITKPMPENAVLENAGGACPPTTCEDLNVLYSIADQYNQDPTLPGSILRVSRAYTATETQCDLEVDINYYAEITDTDWSETPFRKGSYVYDKDGNKIVNTAVVPVGVVKGEKRAFSVHREFSDCSFVLDKADAPGTGYTIQENTPALYKPMEYATRFKDTSSTFLSDSLGTLASVVSDAAATATSLLQTYRTETMAAVGNLTTLGTNCTAKCSDTVILNKLLAYYKTINRGVKQINTVLRVGTPAPDICDITFQEDTLAPVTGGTGGTGTGGTGGTFRIISSTTSGLRFLMIPDATSGSGSGCSFKPEAMRPILPAPPPSTTLNMIDIPSSATCQEVYSVSGSYNQRSAQTKCESYGGTLATFAQLEIARVAGADWCSAGWLADISGGGLYPVTGSIQAGCGNGSAGIKQVSLSANDYREVYNADYPDTTGVTFTDNGGLFTLDAAKAKCNSHANCYGFTYTPSKQAYFKAAIPNVAAPSRGPIVSETPSMFYEKINSVSQTKQFSANCYGVKPKQGLYTDVLPFVTGGAWSQPNACATSALNYVNPSKEAFQNYGTPVKVSESTFPLNRASFGLDMARNKGGPPLDSMFLDPLRSTPTDDIQFLSNGGTESIKPDRATSYKYIRFRPIQTRDALNPTVDIGKIRFLLGTDEIDMGAAKVTNPMGTWVGDIEDVIGEGFRRGWSDSHKKALVFAFPYAVLLNGFTWTTANPDKGLGGDPVQWKLEGSQNGVYWTVLRDQTRHNYPVPTARFQELPIFRF